MRLIKRFTADVRDRNTSEQEAEHMTNEQLIKLQSNEDGSRNTNIEVLDVKEVTKDSGILHFLVIYEDKGLDNSQ